MKKKALIVGVIVGVLLFALAAISLAQDIEILEVKYREVSQSDFGVIISWMVKLQNNTGAAKKVFVKVCFLDGDGFQLDDDIKGVILQPGDITIVTDTAFISLEIYPQIRSIQASL
jgi:hypothetical protein